MTILPGTRLVDHTWVVVDVETTGGRPAGDDRITEFAAVVVAGAHVIHEFSALVHPGRPIPSWITHLTGIDDRMVAHAPSFGDIAPAVASLLARGTFVAHNASFDWGFVSSELARSGVTMDDAPRVCTVRLARRLLRELPRRNLDRDAVVPADGVEIAPSAGTTASRSRPGTGPSATPRPRPGCCCTCSMTWGDSAWTTGANSMTTSHAAPVARSGVPCHVRQKTPLPPERP